MQDLPVLERRTERDLTQSLTQSYVSLVRMATLAASSHNTQPWRFRLGPGQITIRADWARRCPEVDPDDHHLLASLGCATENLLLAARAEGLAGQLQHGADGASLVVSLEAARAERSPRYLAIPERQCDRTRYDGSALTSTELRALERAGSGAGVSVAWLTSARDKEQVAEYVAAGNRAQFGDPRWAQEMRRWIRFNEREARERGDGLYGPSLGIPRVPRRLGELLMPLAASATRQSRKDAADIQSSGAVAVLFSEVDAPRSWIEAGRCFERLALEATALGLRVAFINQPVEVASLRPQLASFLGIGARRPELVLRLGRGPRGPRSRRRPVEDVIDAPRAE